MKRIQVQMDLLMHPIRLRVVQYLIRHKEAAARDIATELDDIPQASLYRHLKKLADGGLIQVVRESPVRGTVEKTYAVVEAFFQPPETKGELRDSISALLLSVAKDFETYFKQGEESSPVEEDVTFQTATLNLNDDEFKAFMRELAGVCDGILDNKLTGDRKVRRITLISSPTIEPETEGKAAVK